MHTPNRSPSFIPAAVTHTHIPTLQPLPPATPINPHVISYNNPCTPCPSIDLALIVPLCLSLSSWSSRLVTCLICRRGSTAPSRTTWRRREGSRVDTFSACLRPFGKSSQSQGTKVGTGRAKGDEVIGVVRSLGGSREQAGVWIRAVLVICVRNLVMNSFYEHIL